MQLKRHLSRVLGRGVAVESDLLLAERGCLVDISYSVEALEALLCFGCH